MKAAGGAAVAAGERVAQQLVRVDPEKTGLDIEKGQIIEVAC